MITFACGRARRNCAACSPASTSTRTSTNCSTTPTTTDPTDSWRPRPALAARNDGGAVNRP